MQIEDILTLSKATIEDLSFYYQPFSLKEMHQLQLGLQMAHSSRLDSSESFFLH